MLKEAGIGNSLALNCALISDKTNISIGRQDPVDYMTKRYEWTSKELVSERLLSHLIPIPELANGGYESLSKEEKIEKLKRDFDAFISRRAELVMKAVQLLADGRQLSVAEVYEE